MARKPEDQYKIGMEYMRIGENEKGIDYLKLAGFNGYHTAFFEVAQFYHNKKDMNRAKIYYEKAAQKKIKIAALNLALIFTQEKNHDMVAKYTKIAKELS